MTTIEVQRAVLGQKAFRSALEKVVTLELPKEDRKSVKKLAESYNEQFKIVNEYLLNAKKENVSEEEQKEFLNKTVELAPLSAHVLENEKLTLSALEEMFLDTLILKN